MRAGGGEGRANVSIARLPSPPVVDGGATWRGVTGVGGMWAIPSAAAPLDGLEDGDGVLAVEVFEVHLDGHALDDGVRVDAQDV